MNVFLGQYCHAQNLDSIQIKSDSLWSFIENKEENLALSFAANNETHIGAVIEYLLEHKLRNDSVILKILELGDNLKNTSLKSSKVIALWALKNTNTVDTLAYIKSNMILGIVESDLGNFQKSLTYLFNALELVNKEGNIKYYTNLLNKLARVYFSLEEYIKSDDIYNELIEIGDDTNDEELLCYAYQNKSLRYIINFEYDSALILLNMSLFYADKNEDEIAQSSVYGNLGYCYYKQGLFEKSKEMGFKGLEIEIRVKRYLNMIDSHVLIALSYGKLGDMDNFDKHFKEAFEIAENLNALEKTKDLYFVGYEFYEEAEDYKNAYLYSLKFNEFYDSLLNIERNNQFAEMREKYETKRKEDEIGVLQRDQKLAKLELEKEKNQKLFFIVLACLLLVAAIGVMLVFIKIRRQSKEIDSRNELITGINQKLSQSQDKLIESNKSKDKFFALIAHDLRGPITSFQGLARMLHYRLKKGEVKKAEELIAAADDSANGINILLDNLLKWALSQSGSLNFNLEPINIKNIVTDTLDIYRQNCQLKKLTVEDLVIDNCMVMADHNTLSTILRNLISNAIKFTAEGGVIKVKSILKDDLYEISIEDNGIGIDENRLMDIFNFNVNKSTAGTKGEKGTGLGLLLCKEFVGKNGGELIVESIPNVKTKFSFSIPAIYEQVLI